MRQVFISFHYNDSWKVQQILGTQRLMQKFQGQKIFSPNEWEQIKKQGDYSIKKWIDENMNNRSCCIVLIGEETAKRRWVKYEIKKAWELGKGVFGIYIHNLKDKNRQYGFKGENPFNSIRLKNGQYLSSYVKVYEPRDLSDIVNNIEMWIEKAILERY